MAVSSDLKKVDSALYVFQPADQDERFFIGEAILFAIATALLTAFFKGIISDLEKRSHAAGALFSGWMCEKIEGLFRSKTPQADKKGLDQAASEAKGVIANLSIDRKTKAIDEVENALKANLKAKGMLDTQASEIAAIVRESAEKLLII